MSGCQDFCIAEDASDPWLPCHCPKCGGFLPKDFPLDAQFKCPQCDAMLQTIPNPPEEGEYEPDERPDPEEDYENFGGRICVVPNYAVAPKEASG